MHPPYDSEKLDRLMEAVGVDMVLVSTRHNIRYLCGGYFFHFHERFTAIGPGRYLPLAGVPRAAPGRAFLVGGGGEKGQARDQDLWLELIPSERSPEAAARDAAAAVRARGLERGCLAVERDFLPASAMETLAKELPGARFAEAQPIMEELRAVKRPDELDILRRITQADAEAIQEAFRTSPPGPTTREVVRTLERGMTNRGLHFLWAFASAGTAMLRAPSEKVWERGEALHLDAGGSDGDYLTDVCRMGVRGKPSPLAEEVFQACLATQDRVRAAIRPGALCGEIYELGQKAFEETGFAGSGRFLIHGIGMVSHEQPRFGPGAERPLEAGMVASVETDIRHPEAGYVKIEDAVAVTPSGCEGLGDLGREAWAVVE